LTLDGALTGDLLVDLAADVYTWYTAQAAWRASCAQVAVHLPNVPGLRILDVGCGPGVSTFEQARARPGAFVVGADFNMRVLKHARRLKPLALQHVEIRWLRADAGQLPIAGSSIDAVTAHSFLYFVRGRSAVLKEIWRVLRPGGVFITMEPSAGALHVERVLALSLDPRFLLSIALWRPFSRIHLQFTPDSLCETLDRGGFKAGGTEECLGGLGIVAWAFKA
jgi:ubiquinone/menaquinone biosynthesis C-methylase UbiE